MYVMLTLCTFVIGIAMCLGALVALMIWVYDWLSKVQ